MLQILKKKAIWIPALIVLCIAILIVCAWPAIQKATHKTYLEYESGVPYTGSLQEYCQNADLIIQGTVSEVGTSFQKDSGNVYTPLTLQINKTYKGDAALSHVTLYEQYGEYKNATWLYYPPEIVPQIPMKQGDTLILFLKNSSDDASLTHYGSFVSVSGNAVALNPYIREVESLPGIGDDLTMPLSEFEALIADNL